MAILSITSLGNLTADTSSDADTTMEAFYKDGYTNTSFEMINGRLDKDNLTGSRPIGASQIKQNVLAGGRMVGSTGNLDYVEGLFPSNNGDAGAYLKIPGCSISYFLPYDCSVVMFTWSVSSNSTINYDTASGGATSTADVAELKFYVDGGFAAHQFRSIPPAHDQNTTNNPLQSHRFRVWAGHHMEQDMTQGWHSAHIALYTSKDMVRLRIRNLKVIWFK